MIISIVWHLVWFVTVTVPTECPDWKPDPYTGLYPSYHCAVYHCKTETKKMEKDFASEEEAKAFVKACPDKSIKFTLEKVTDCHVNEIPISRELVKLDDEEDKTFPNPDPEVLKSKFEN